MNSFVIKGDLCYSINKKELITLKNAYAVCIDGTCQGVYESNPELYKDLPLLDYSDKLIIPGLVDLHTHAPQYAFCGLNMDLELLSWLNSSAFEEEKKYDSLPYAMKAYNIFSSTLKQSATTRACVFATIHNNATKILMNLLENSGLVCYVGRVNMDRNSPSELCEESAQKSAQDTEQFIIDTINAYKNIKPILTPRFIPSCSDELMAKLSALQKKYSLPVQSHLSENTDEINWVKELCPNSSSYADAYDSYSLFGNSAKTVMAHCVHCTDDEIDLIKRNGVFVAHCPASNSNLSSGIAPIRKYLDRDLKVGLGSDVAGGNTLSLFSTMVECIKVSKLYRKLIGNLQPIKFEEAFYLATKGGGEFFGKVGSFLEGYEFDAVIIDDSNLKHPQELNVSERLQRSVYMSADLTCIKAKFIKGKQIL